LPKNNNTKERKNYLVFFSEGSNIAMEYSLLEQK